jgi:hypothetical protein
MLNIARVFNAQLPDRFRYFVEPRFADYWFTSDAQRKLPEYEFTKHSKGDILEDTSAEGKRLQLQLEAAKRVASPTHRRDWDGGDLTLIMALEHKLAICENDNNEDRKGGIIPRRLDDEEALTLKILDIEWTNH